MATKTKTTSRRRASSVRTATLAKALERKKTTSSRRKKAKKKTAQKKTAKKKTSSRRKTTQKKKTSKKKASKQATAKKESTSRRRSSTSKKKRAARKKSSSRKESGRRSQSTGGGVLAGAVVIPETQPTVTVGSVINTTPEQAVTAVPVDSVTLDLRPFDVVEVEPTPNSSDVKARPALFSLRFNKLTDRRSVERKIMVTPGSRDLFFRWEVCRPTKEPISAQSVRAVRRSRVNARSRKGRSSGEVDIPVEHEILHVLHGTPPQDIWERGRTYTLTLDKGARSESGAELKWAYKFKVHVEGKKSWPAPGNHVGRRLAGTRRGRPVKRAIVLSGGGAKGDFEVGALQVLYKKEKFFPDIVTGISVGAINAVKLAEGGGRGASHIDVVEELEDLWLTKIRGNDSIYVNSPGLDKLEEELGPMLSGGGGSMLPTWLFHVLHQPLAFLPMSILMGIGNLLSFGFLTVAMEDKIKDELDRIMKIVDDFLKEESLFRVDPLRDLLRRNVRLDRLRDSEVELLLGAVSLNTGEYRDLDKSGDVIEAVMASAMMPVFFPPVDIGAHRYIDGGVRETAALRSAIAAGANDIVVISASAVGDWQQNPLDADSNEFNTWGSIFARGALELPFEEILRNDVEPFIEHHRKLNDYIDDDIRIRVIDPKYALHDTLNFDPEGIRRGIEYGKQRAQEVLFGRSNYVVPEPIEVTTTSYLVIVKPIFDSGEWIRDEAAQAEETWIFGSLDVEIDLFLPGKVEAGPFVSYTQPGAAGIMSMLFGGKDMFYALPVHHQRDYIVQVRVRGKHTNTMPMAISHEVDRQLQDLIATGKISSFEVDDKRRELTEAYYTLRHSTSSLRFSFRPNRYGKMVVQVPFDLPDKYWKLPDD